MNKAPAASAASLLSTLIGKSIQTSTRDALLAAVGTGLVNGL